MKLVSHIIALSLPNADPLQIAAALSIGVVFIKKMLH